MVCSSHSLRFRPFSREFCTISSDRYHVLLQFHCIFQYILMVFPATKKADLGGIDTPPSANCLVVLNPAKCSVFWRSTQGHGEISFPFGNRPPPHPLFSLCSQTATSQLAGFRKNNCHFGRLFGTGIVEAKPLYEIEKLIPIWGPFKPEFAILE